MTSPIWTAVINNVILKSSRTISQRKIPNHNYVLPKCLRLFLIFFTCCLSLRFSILCAVLYNADIHNKLNIAFYLFYYKIVEKPSGKSTWFSSSLPYFGIGSTYTNNLFQRFYTKAMKLLLGSSEENTEEHVFYKFTSWFYPFRHSQLLCHRSRLC